MPLLTQKHSIWDVLNPCPPTEVATPLASNCNFKLLGAFFTVEILLSPPSLLPASESFMPVEINLVSLRYIPGVGFGVYMAFGREGLLHTAFFHHCGPRRRNHSFLGSNVKLPFRWTLSNSYENVHCALIFCKRRFWSFWLSPLLGLRNVAFTSVPAPPSSAVVLVLAWIPASLCLFSLDWRQQSYCVLCFFKMTKKDLFLTPSSTHHCQTAQE